MQVFEVAHSIACINNVSLHGNIYISLNIGVGLASRRIHADSEKKFVGSATANVYFNYVRTRLKKKYDLDVNCSVSMNTTSIFWKSKEDQYETDIQHVIDEIFSDFIDETAFMQEKKASIERFKTYYKNLEFRGRFKMMEFTHKNKDFQFEYLSQDLLDANVADVRTMQKYLFYSKNLFLFLHGAADKEVVKQISIPKIEPVDVKFLFSLENFRFLQDEAFIKKSKGDYQCGALKFERLPTLENLSKEYAVLTLIGEIMFKGYFIIEVDHMDASILYYETPLQKYKYNIEEAINRDTVAKAKERYTKRFDRFLSESPKAFTELAGRLHFDKINIFQWFEYVKQLTANEITTFLTMRNYKIREGYLDYYKGEREHGII